MGEDIVVAKLVGRSGAWRTEFGESVPIESLLFELNLAESAKLSIGELVGEMETRPKGLPFRFEPAMDELVKATERAREFNRTQDRIISSMDEGDLAEQLTAARLQRQQDILAIQRILHPSVRTRPSELKATGLLPIEGPPPEPSLSKNRIVAVTGEIPGGLPGSTVLVRRICVPSGEYKFADLFVKAFGIQAMAGSRVTNSVGAASAALSRMLGFEADDIRLDI